MQPLLTVSQLLS